ncbi:MAG: tetratricopeptide repeat protein, partial [Spirochaetaceae bacterium]|nr:tetratricopeptide repeat protein [Spirochaetaceae bacterium]
MDYRKIYTGEPDYGRAIEAYTQAIRRDPFDAASCLCRGRLYAAQDKYDQAFQDYDRAVGMKPDNAAAYALRGDAYLAMKRYDKAVEDYNHAIEIEDQPAFREAKAQAYYEQGCDLYAKEQFEDAIALYHKILSPNFAAAHLGLGMVHRAQKKYMEAIQDFNQVLEKDPANAAAYRYRGGVYFALASDVEQARIAFGEESRGIQ